MQYFRTLTTYFTLRADQILTVLLRSNQLWHDHLMLRQVASMFPQNYLQQIFFLLNAFRPHVCKQHNNCAVIGVRLQSEHFILSKSCSFFCLVQLTCLTAHLWNLLRLTWRVFMMYNLIHLHPGCLNSFHCLIYSLSYTINIYQQRLLLLWPCLCLKIALLIFYI